MSDLLSMLGDEWALPDADEPSDHRCTHPDRANVTHGCRESGRVPLHWSDVGDAGYVDGMGRRTRCNYCSACVGSGRVMIRDPWTDMPVPSPIPGHWHASASCLYCGGTGWIGHAWDCDGAWHAKSFPIKEPLPAEAFGIAYPRRTVIPGELALPA